MIAAAPPRLRVPMVRPAGATVARGVADLRAEPDDGADLVDQAQYGERLTLLGARPGWSYVQGPDHYCGWIRDEHLIAADLDAARILVAVPLAEIRDAPDPSGRCVDTLPVGSPVAVRGAPRRGWLPVRVRDGVAWIAAADTAAESDLPSRPPSADDLLATARTFLGAPYLWGGTTSAGIDCSGLVQQVYRLNGVALDRDADQQSLEGRPVDLPAPGDLLFFGAERVTHVAIAAGGRSFIHAPMRGGAVEVGSLDSRGDPRSIRRYLAG